MQHIKSYRKLRVYQAAIDAAMRIFELTKKFPVEERFSMVDQVRRSSRWFARTPARHGANDAIRIISKVS